MIAPPGRSVVGFIIILILAVATGAIFFFRPKLSNVPQTGTSPTPTVESTLKTWTDPAGFSFQYPEGIVINPHEDDNVNYAHVELMHADHTGSLIVWVKDTSSADVSAWVKTEKQFTGASILDSVLGGEPAKKVMLQTPQAKLYTGTIYDELLFMVEADLTDREYWQSINNGVVESFTFVPLEGEKTLLNAEADTYEEEYAVDEEEVLE